MRILLSNNDISYGNDILVMLYSIVVISLLIRRYLKSGETGPVLKNRATSAFLHSLNTVVLVSLRMLEKLC